MVPKQHTSNVRQSYDVCEFDYRVDGDCGEYDDDGGGDMGESCEFDDREDGDVELLLDYMERKGKCDGDKKAFIEGSYEFDDREDGDDEMFRDYVELRNVVDVADDGEGCEFDDREEGENGDVSDGWEKDIEDMSEMCEFDFRVYGDCGEYDECDECEEDMGELCEFDCRNKTRREEVNEDGYENDECEFDDKEYEQDMGEFDREDMGEICEFDDREEGEEGYEIMHEGREITDMGEICEFDCAECIKKYVKGKRILTCVKHTPKSKKVLRIKNEPKIEDKKTLKIKKQKVIIKRNYHYSNFIMKYECILR